MLLEQGRCGNIQTVQYLSPWYLYQGLFVFISRSCEVFEAERGPGGRFLTKPKGIEQYAITKENAAEMAKRRWEKYREAAADAVVEEMGAILPGISTPEQAWGVLNARLASQIMDSNKPRGDDLMQLGRNMGAIPNAHERSEMENQSAPVGLASAVSELAAILRAAIAPEQREIIDGKVSEPDHLRMRDITDIRNEDGG
jgi:hypothetical protein